MQKEGKKAMSLGPYDEIRGQDEQDSGQREMLSGPSSLQHTEDQILLLIILVGIPCLAISSQWFLQRESWDRVLSGMTALNFVCDSILCSPG